MEIIYWHSRIKNFGDELNKDFYHKALGLDVSHFKPAEAILGVGSILDYDTSGHQVINVLGSGSGFSSLSLKNFGSYKFWFVRGPLTARTLEIDESLAMGDPAILVPKVYQFDFQSEPRSGTLFIPHYFSAMSGDWGAACEIANIKFRNPMSDLRDICKDIATSNLVITESLHGAILADTYRTPWILVATPPIARSPFKWHDWLASINKSYMPIDIPSLWTKKLSLFEKMTNFSKCHLANTGVGPVRWKNKSYRVHGEREMFAVGNLLRDIAINCEPTLSDSSHLKKLQGQMEEKLNSFKEYVIN